MDGVRRHFRSVKTVSTYTITSLLVVLTLLFVIGCRSEGVVSNDSPVSQKKIIIDDISIPVFSTADEQMNYTRSWFADIEEKKAALKAFLLLHPEERILSGVAELELAYLRLGEDYRLASEADCLAAIGAYEQVVEQYHQYSELLAKAHWYMGWINSSLLGKREQGVALFYQVIENYPDIPVSLLPSAPWVSIIYETGDTSSVSPHLHNPDHWAALAHLEITRHSSDEEMAWRAFQQLWNNFRKERATGFALKIILQRRIHFDQALNLAEKYLEANFTNVHILGDIRGEIKRINSSSNGL